jgi:hypothetical protein
VAVFQREQLHSLTNESEHIPLLQAEGGMHRQDAFDKPAPFRRMGAVGQLSQNDAVPKDSFPTVIRRLNPFLIDERPQRVRMTEQLSARPACLDVRDGGPSASNPSTRFWTVRI